MRVAHLFSGAGGGLLADLILGHTPVLAVEWNKACCDSLRERAGEGWLPELHVYHGDVRDFDWRPWAGKVDCLAAGFPCQDISSAGGGAGIKGKRSGLVSEVFRAIDAVRPGIVWLENSPRIRTRGRHVVIAELVARGYAWRDGRLAAADTGAAHERERWWCVAANADGMRQLEQEGGIAEQWRRACDRIEAIADLDSLGPGRREVRPGGNDDHRDDAGREEKTDRPAECPKDVADCLRHRLQVAVQCGGLQPAEAASIEAAARYTGAYHWSPPDAGICGVVDGLAAPLDGNTKRERIKAAGNGQVPISAAAAWLILTGPQGPCAG